MIVFEGSLPGFKWTRCIVDKLDMLCNRISILDKILVAKNLKVGCQLKLTQILKSATDMLKFDVQVHPRFSMSSLLMIIILIYRLEFRLHDFLT